MVGFGLPVAGLCATHYLFIICIKFATAGHLFKALFQTGCVKKRAIDFLFAGEETCLSVVNGFATSLFLQS